MFRHQFIDLTIKGLRKGELTSVINSVGLNNLINTESKEFKRLNLDRITTLSVKEEILLNNSSVYKTPIVPMENRPL